MLNDVVLHPGAAVQMIEFVFHIEGQFVYSQRSDALLSLQPPVQPSFIPQVQLAHPAGYCVGACIRNNVEQSAHCREWEQ